jgi:DNA-binding transcriptional LysR family regulator
MTPGLERQGETNDTSASVKAHRRLGAIERQGPRLLYYFVAVAEELSFSKAATRLNMSQPPLSLHIRELEALLDVQLFLRNTRSVELTAAGRMLYEQMCTIQGMTHQCLRHVSQMAQGEVGHMSIGLVGSVAWGGFLTALRDFSNARPGVTWTIRELSPAQQIDALQRHQIDIGVWRATGQDALPGNLVAHLIGQERLLAAVPASGTALAAGVPMALSSLEGASLICLSQAEHSLGRYITEVLARHGVRPVVARQVAEPQTALALVAENEGLTLLPESYARIDWPGVRFLALDPPLFANLCAVTDRTATVPVAQRFLDVMRLPSENAGPPQ